MTQQTGILAVGGYVPLRRLQRASVFALNAWFAPGTKAASKGERAIASWDEDAITMAVEAARDCLVSVDRNELESVTVASTTLPFADRLNAAVVKEALNLPDSVFACDQGGSLRAGTSALIAALGGTKKHLVLASDRRKARPASEAELSQGDAAAAILVGRGEIIARLIGTYSVTVDFVDHFRASGQDFDYAWESRWLRDEGYEKLLSGAIRTGLEKIGVAAGEIDKIVIPITAKGISENLARRVGIKPEAVCDTLGATVGDSGVPHPLLMLSAALQNAQPGQKILLVGIGQGADVLVFEATEAISHQAKRRGVAGHLARAEKDTNYMRFLFHRGLLDLERGMRAELDQKQPGTTLYRHRKEVLGLVGGRCTKSGTVQFPKSDIGVNPNDRNQSGMDDYPLADRRAKIITYTADSLTYSPDPPVNYGAIDFEGGGRLVVEFTDCCTADMEVGREVRMMFRIKAIDELRKFTKYFWKAAPIREGDV